MRTSCGIDVPDMAIKGIGMRYLSPVRVTAMFSGVRWIRMGMFTTFSCTSACQKAAKKAFRMLLKRVTHVPRVIVTDKLQSYGAAKRKMLPSTEHQQPRYLNHRTENSY